MVGLNSAIREQRRNPKNIVCAESEDQQDPHNLVNSEPGSFDTGFEGYLGPYLEEPEDLDVINEWICEPEWFGMEENQKTSNTAMELQAKEAKQVCEEFSPISFTVENEGSASPCDVDNVGARFGEVCLNGHRGFLSAEVGFDQPTDDTGHTRGKFEGILSEKVTFEKQMSDSECRSEKIEGLFSEKLVSVNPIAGTDSPRGKTREIPMDITNNMTTLCQSRGDKERHNVAESAEVHNVTTSGNGVSEISMPDRLLVSKEEYVEDTGLLQRTRDITERNVAVETEVCLDGYKSFEQPVVANAECPTGQIEEIPMETPHNLESSGHGIFGVSVTRSLQSPNKGHADDNGLIQRIGHSHTTEDNSIQLSNRFKNKKTKREDSDVESGEIISEDDGEECSGMLEADTGEDCTGMVEPDSEYCSDSSSSSISTDESEEEEEGEIKSEKERRKMQRESLEYDLGSSDEEGPKGPIRSKNEIQVLPPVPPVTVGLKGHHQTQPAGMITSVLGTSVVVEGRECHTPLNEGTILWVTDKRMPLGFIDEVFGPVKNPYYLVRFNTVRDVPDFVKEGVHVSYVPEFASYVLNNPDLHKKGYDASGDNDEELFEEIEFSDDEKEAEYKRARSNAKRGVKSRQIAQEKNNGRAWKNQDFVNKRKSKVWGDKSPHNANNANGQNGRAQEVQFASNKPFGNGARNWRPPLPMNQINHHTMGNNGIQQHSPQQLGPQSDSVKQAAVLPKEIENRRQGPKRFSGAPSSWGRGNSKPNRDVSGGTHSVQAPVVVGKSECGVDNSASSSIVVHSSPSHEQAQGPTFGQIHMRPVHDLMGQASPGQPHSRISCDPAPRIHLGQPFSRAPFQQSIAGINSSQPPVLGGPVLNGNQMNVNPMGFPVMSMHPAFFGQPPQNTSIQPASTVMAWNTGQPNHAAGGSQLRLPNVNQGTGNPLHLNQMNTCVGIPVIQHPGMNPFCNMGTPSGHNVLPCHMPWGQTIIQGNPSQQFQGNPSQQFQAHLPSQNSVIPFSQPNNMSGNIQRPPLAPPQPTQLARDRQQPS